jgi:S1-C subfamily serine protease
MWLTVASGPDRGKRVRATGQRFIIGRDGRCDLVVRDEKVSRQHALLKLHGDGQAILQDLGSANGTFVNGRRIQAPLLLQGGEQVQVGDTVVSLSLIESPDGLAGPLAQQTVVRAVTLPGKTASQSTLERLVLRQSLRRTRMVAVIALVLALTAVALFVANVLPPGGGEPTPAEIVEAVGPATVLVITMEDAQPLGTGTGWVLDAAEGLIVTNHHVVSGGTDFTIGVADSQREAELVATAPCEDLAVLRVDDTSGLRTMPLGAQDDLRLGDPVVAVGFPMNASLRDELTATTGVVSVLHTRFVGGGPFPHLADVIQTDAAINPGNSGGPLVSARRALVGVNTIGSVTLQNTNYAIGVDRVKQIIADLREGRSLGWAGLSLEVPMEASDLTALQLPPIPGLVATAAFPGTAAEKSGFGRMPALIVAIDGKPMDDGIVSYCDTVGNYGRGERAVLSVVSPGRDQPIDVPITFE